MTTTPCCPICDATDWEDLDERTYRAADRDSADGYVAPRYDVMFRVWWPGRTEVTITYVMCRDCGFVMYAPRPSEADVAAKYAYLSRRGGPVGHALSDDGADRARAAALHRTLAPLLPPCGARILDLGGGDGRMLRPFLDAGHHGVVVDHNRNPIPGIVRLGATLDEVDEEERFDAALSLHVLEHLANPRRVLEQLRARMRTGGLLFVEVPLEVWRGRPEQIEPVTHINFFSRDSLGTLLRRSGFTDVRCWEQTATAPSGAPIFVVRASGRALDMAADAAAPAGADHTRRLLHPSAWERAKWIARNPAFYTHPGFLKRKTAKLLGRGG